MLLLVTVTTTTIGFTGLVVIPFLIESSSSIQAIDAVVIPTTSTQTAAAASTIGQPQALQPLLLNSNRPTTSDAASTDTAGSSPATSNPGGADGRPCFRLLARDDFDGATLGSQWIPYATKGSHSPHAIRRPAAISVSDGLLRITAQNDETGTLVSGGLRHALTQTYGRYSLRVRTDPDLTNTTSGVVLTWPTSENQPLDGENNLYETLTAPGSRNPFYSFIHEPFDDRADGVSQTRFVHNADATQWQEITMEWTPDYVSIHRSGPGAQLSQTQRIDESDANLIADVEHFLAIQLDLFKGAFPDDRAVRMEIDWVEISSYCGG